MKTNLDVTCDPEAWASLTKLQQFELMLKAKQDPVFFWEHPAMGNQKLWPSQKELLRDFNTLDENGKRKYKELLFAAGMRSGKSTIAGLIILTELYKCMFMESPQTHYKLLPKEEILFLCTASTEKQCHRTIFKKTVALVENSPYFCSFDNEIELTQGKLKFPKNLIVLGLGSNLKANVGLTVKVFVAEEINFTGEATYKVSPSILYNKLSKSTTTFKAFGEDIKVAISSRADGNDFLSKRIQMTKDQKLETTLILQKDILEMNPHITPEMLEDERLMDEESYLNDYGLGIARGGMSYFKKRTLDKLVKWDRPNAFQGDPEHGKDKGFVPHLDLSILKYDKEAICYGLFTDPASRGDGFGFCLAHMNINQEIIVDGLTVFRPNKGQEIDPLVVREFIKKIINVVPVEFYVFDIYMYNEIRKEIEDLGVTPKQNMLKLPQWEALKERIDTERIHGPKVEYLEKEISDLILINGKVNHPSGGSKDMADALCQSVAFWDDPEKIDKIEEEQFLIIKGGR